MVAAGRCACPAAHAGFRGIRPSVCEHAFVSIKGSAHARFQHSLATGNPLLVRAAAAELDHIGLPDALSICLVFLRHEPHSYSRAAARFHARVAIEAPRIDLTSSHQLLSALNALQGTERHDAAIALAELSEALNLPEVAARIDAWLEA